MLYPVNIGHEILFTFNYKILTHNVINILLLSSSTSHIFLWLQVIKIYYQRPYIKMYCKIFIKKSNKLEVLNILFVFQTCFKLWSFYEQC